MRTLVGKLLVVACLFFSTVAVAQINEIGDWLHRPNVDRITDADRSMVVALATEHPSYARASGVVLRCEASEPLGVDLYFNADRYLGSADRVEVTYRIDGGTPVTQRWNPSTDREAVFAPVASIESLVQSLLDSQELIFRVSARTASYTYVVPTSGMRGALAELGCYSGSL